ncbi:sensor histidine kinase [Streptomyces sp. NPDC005805]|uniref:sensor histidine kinase n=1 Tax=Streptomyces sp. NPDC005805 TaxID=3157068 RepID=UPI003404BEDF
MTGPSPAPRPSPPPGDGPRARLLRRLRRGARVVAAELGTASPDAAPLFGGAGPRWVRWLPYLVVFGCVSALLPVTVTVLIQDYRLNGALAGALATAQTAPLLLAVTRPMHAWWIVLTADVLGAFALLGADGTEGRSWPWTPMVVVGYLVLMACLGLREPRRRLVAVWLATGAAGLLFELVSQRYSDGVHLLLFVLSGVVLVVTGALRERGEAQRLLHAQETISEAERAQRTLLEERTRIARELHDVVAHHMSVITVQADSAPYRIDGLPDAAREEFASIAAGARESLTEMRRLLTVLRSDGSAGEKAPQPGLERVPQLVAATVRAGVPAELSLPEALSGGGSGSESGSGGGSGGGEVPPAVDLSAYRIVQEALANVVRHAPGARTRVSITADDRELTVLVVNGPPSGAVSPLEAAGTGHGLVGMRERVRLTGGTLDAGPLPDGGYRVAARLPLDGGDAAPGVGDTDTTGGGS